MQETILSRLEASRKELLDLGLRNPLLHYRIPKSRGLHIVQEKSAFVYDILVKQGKAMSFLAKPGNQKTQEAEEQETFAFLEPTEEALEAAYSDTKLQTEETEGNLQHRLLNTYYAARTSLEEQGVNILYLALGMLCWFETAQSEEERKAPLLLIPVSLERSTARERFRLRYTGAEVEANLSLQARLKADFGLALPDLPEGEEFDVLTYLESVAEAVAAMPRWQLSLDSLELGFFSFGKFMIYHDLDNAKWPENSRPAEHPLLQALFLKGFQEPLPTVPEEAFLDGDTEADQLFQTVDADSSQLLAMLAVQEGRNLVIQGPPGTGKSQTITNIIANAIGQGKKVLFVAEKMAALEVVKRRLDSIHLGEACLELHSHKSNKKELHEELRRVLELGKPSLEHLQGEVSLLDRYKDELNAYSFAVNTEINKSGLSAQQLMGHLLQLEEKIRNVSLPRIEIENIAQWQQAHMQQAEAMAERIQARLKDIGLPTKLLFWGSRLKVLLPHEQEALRQLLESAAEAVEQLREASEAAALTFGLQHPANRQDAERLRATASLLSEQPDLKELTIASNDWLVKQADLEVLLQAGMRFAQLHENYRDVFIAGAWGQPMLEIRGNLLAYGDKWYRFLVGAYRKSNKQLAALCKGPLPKENAQKLQYVDALLEASALEKIVSEHEQLASRLFGRRWQKLNSNWPALQTAALYLAWVQRAITEEGLPEALLAYLSTHPDAAIAQDWEQALREKMQAQEERLQQLLQKLAFDEGQQFPQTGLQPLPFSEQQSLLEAWTQRLPELHQAISWNNLVESAVEEELPGLVKVAEQWPFAKDLLRAALQKTWYEYLLEQAVTVHPPLRKFERSSHEEAVKKFQRLDMLNLAYNRARAALKHWESIPRMEAGGQVNILRAEFNKKSRHMPIRRLMQEAGLAIQALKPVFMMSPLSIANFLPPASLEFDLVIFDEASQVRPVEALGAILRAKQLVVVGDTRQLPPTSFFDSLTREAEEEENVTADLQSILGMCDAQGAPQRMLRWHYRSRHESLISLSNQEFYENKLVIFPSPGAAERLGLVYHHLQDTAYDRGKTRTNPKEAAVVADAVMAHAQQHPGLSLGVVAFSNAQMQAIQNELELRRRRQPALEGFFKSHQHEPFFVKNLENVQGDERDVIFISLGYGRTEEGQLSMSFGPLNNEGGERRLNVLITRAKMRCEVFTNITADDIDLNRTKQFGVRALKNFLHFAQHGSLYSQQPAPLLQQLPFEEMVAYALERQGYRVKKRVGSQGFHIDLALEEPSQPGRYLLGIVCDGASYHAARSARDRDRLRGQVLENMGWRLHRIWSTDWFRNPERELKRVQEAVARAQVLSQQEAQLPQQSPLGLPSLLREEAGEVTIDLPAYAYATLPAELAERELHLHPIARLAEWVVQVVEAEAPVHCEEVIRRIAEAARISRVGQRVRQSLLEAIHYALQKGQITQKEDFLWHSQHSQLVLRDRSKLPASSKKLKFIAPEEIMLAVEKVVRESIAIQPEAAVPFIARLFGFVRVTEDMKKEILALVEQAQEEGILIEEGGWLRMPQQG